MPTSYITGGLAEFALPPYDFSEFVSATFILDADDETLKGLCDQFLNGPLNRSATANDEFVPGGDNRMIMVCSTFPDVSADAAQSFGYSIYSETAFLFSVFDRKNLEWGWYVPVLYLDGPATVPQEWQAELPIAVGRELFGLPKARAEIEINPVSHTGTVKPIDPSTPGNPVTVSQAVSIDLTACEIPSVDDVLAVNETELLGRVIQLQRGIRTGTLDARGQKRLKGQISELRAGVAKLRTKRNRTRRARQDAFDELTLLHRRPEKRQILKPADLIRMLWGGNPYGNVDLPPPEEPVLLTNLGFIKRSAEPIDGTSPGPDPQFEYEFDFRLLGLRQLRNPEQPSEASIQQVIRSQLLFDRLPWSPMQQFCVRIADPLATALGVGPHQKLAADKVYVYHDANASFGDGKIVT